MDKQSSPKLSIPPLLRASYTNSMVSATFTSGREGGRGREREREGGREEGKEGDGGREGDREGRRGMEEGGREGMSERELISVTVSACSLLNDVQHKTHVCLW